MSDDVTPPSPLPLIAAGGLIARLDGDVVRIGYAGHDDWFGPGGLRVAGEEVALADGRTVRGVDDLGEWVATMWLGDRGAEPRIDASVAAYVDEPVLVFSLRAPVGAGPGLATGDVRRPGGRVAALRARRSLREVACPRTPRRSATSTWSSRCRPRPTPTFADWTRWPFRPSVMMPLLCVAEVGHAARGADRPVPRAGRRGARRRRARGRRRALRLARRPGPRCPRASAPSSRSSRAPTRGTASTAGPRC